MYLHRSTRGFSAEADSGPGAGMSAVRSAGMPGPCCTASPAQQHSWYWQISLISAPRLSCSPVPVYATSFLQPWWWVWRRQTTNGTVWALSYMSFTWVETGCARGRKYPMKLLQVGFRYCHAGRPTCSIKVVLGHETSKHPPLLLPMVAVPSSSTIKPRAGLAFMALLMSFTPGLWGPSHLHVCLFCEAELWSQCCEPQWCRCSLDTLSLTCTHSLLLHFPSTLVHPWHCSCSSLSHTRCHLPVTSWLCT